MDVKLLIQKAFEARKNAYAPYSGYMVGAALLGKNGIIYTGCNIESATYSPTNCGERTAFFKAISEGVKDFTAIAIVGGIEDTKDGDFDFAPPCGVCRQVMAEFCSYEDFDVILAKSVDEYKIYKLGELLPLGFDKSKLD